MPTISDILKNLNSYYTEVTDLVPNFFPFSDDFTLARDEFEIDCSDPPLGNFLYRDSNGKLLWCGISGGSSSGGYNIRRYNSNYSIDNTFNPPTFDDNGNNGFVRQVGEQSDGKLIVVGHFTNINSGTSVGRIMRLNTDGTLDNSFSSGLGFDDAAYVIKVLSNDKILVGGDFNTYDGTGCEKIVRLNSDGTLDGSFTPDPIFDGIVLAIEVANDGKIYVGGIFSNKIVRLNSDGTTDGAYNVGSGFSNGDGNNPRVNSIVIQSDGKIVVGHWFKDYNGSSCNPYITRFNDDGTIDGSFATDGSGLNAPKGSVQNVAIQSNGKILVGGWFTTLNGVRQTKLVRLNANGSKDTSFDIGYGFNWDSNNHNGSRIQHILVNTNGSILVTGSVYSYRTNRINAFAKLSSTGSLDTTVELFKYTKTWGIGDGHNDMYDGGNYINTNLTQAFSVVNGDSADTALCIPNTHSACSDRSAFDDGENPSLYNYAGSNDGVVKTATSYFGSGSNYFTNLYPGMFVMVATNINIEEFSITGDLGSDGDTDVEVQDIEINNQTYACFMKTNIEDSGSDPTVNHIILVPGSSSGLTHLTNVDGDDYDDDCVQGLTGRDHIYYILVSTADAQRLSFEDCQLVAQKFLEVIARSTATEEIKSCVKTVCANKAGFPCHVPTSTNAANCKCATWRMFYPRCSVILQNLGRCSASAGAYVPAITVCNERLF